MSTTIDLDKLEKKVFSTTHQDGLIDILLGIIFLQFSIAPLLTDIGFSDFEASAVFIPVWLIGFLLFFLAKKFIVTPRTGKIKPGKKRKLKLQKANIVLLIILFAGFLIGLLYNDFSDSIDFLFPLTFSIIILLVSMISAYYFDINRLNYYGIMIACAPIIGEILWNNRLVSHHGFPLMFGIVSFILITVGMILLIRFLKLYSNLKMEE
jgi:MFS family permease